MKKRDVPAEALTVSVVLPVYNGGRYLPSAVESIAAQSYPAIEIILVDDGSTDDSALVIAELVAAHVGTPLVHVTQVNAGQSAARNAGVAVARGDLVAFLDQDDGWHPDHLRHLVAPFAGRPWLGWAYSDFDEIDVAGNVVTRDFMRSYNFDDPKNSIGQLLSRDVMVLPSASVLRTSALRIVGGFDVRLRGYEDDDLFIRFFRAGWEAVFVARSLTRFRVHPGSSSTQSMFRQSRMIFFEKLATELPDDPRMNRLYVSDVLLPRIMYSTMADYSTALTLRAYRDAAEIADHIATLSSARRSTWRQRVGLSILRRPSLARKLLRARDRLPRWLRPRLPGGLWVRR